VAKRVTEAALGKRWAETMRKRNGWWVQKLPSSALAGLPDWLAAIPYSNELRLVEAKREQPSRRFAYHPKQLTHAQHFFLEAVNSNGGRADVLVLAEDGYATLRYGQYHKPLPRHQFNRIKEEYDDAR
jgi:hypothetical protein